jgi:hypothetical protein
MDSEEIKIPDTSHWGIKEHFIRAGMFYNAGMHAENKIFAFRVFLASVYSCRAIAELMLEEAQRGELTIDREALKAIVVQKLPYCNLIERIRIHDFHRYGLQPPVPGLKGAMMHGPMTLMASNGMAAMQITPAGPVFTTTGNSTIIKRRSLFTDDGRFYDEDTEAHVSLPKMIKDYLLAVPSVVDEFEKLYRNSNGHVPYEDEEEGGPEVTKDDG